MTNTEIEATEGPRQKTGADDPVVQGLRKVDDKLLAIQMELEQEKQALRLKFEKKFQPMLASRAEELTKGGKAGCGTPALEKFWLTVLKNSDEFEEEIFEYDEPVLEAISDVTYAYLDDKDFNLGWKLTFHFVENDYLVNRTITKTFTTKLTSVYDRTQPEYIEIASEDIEWKQGKDVTVEVKKVKGGGAKKAKRKGKTQARPSFFRSFFRSLSDEGDLPADVLEQLEEDDEEMDPEEIKVELFQDDIDKSESLRDVILPHAVRYYTGEACESDESGSDDDEEDESESESDSEEERNVPKAAMKAGGRRVKQR